MACRCSCKSKITDEQKKILTAMAGMETPCGCKDVSTATGIDDKSVGSHLKTLKTNGYVDNPVRCKYAITAEGKAVI